ncbi:MAG: succinylglutamate desuccinylase/aspartoacylase family protein [Candidatus Woesearchaeota archaeon]
MKVGTCIEKRGRITRGSLRVGTYKRNPVKLPVYIAAGRSSGKTIFISGGMHGDELNGIDLVQQFFHSLDVSKLKGTIVILPVLNILGYRAERRNIVGNQDLNRSFSKGYGSLSNNVANKIFKDVITQCSFGIDCHGSGTESALFPHTRVHINKKRICTGGCTVDIGALFGTEVIMEREGKPGMMAIESFKKLNVPILTVELGGGLVLFKKFIQVGLMGINNLLMHHHMTDGKLILPRFQYHVPDVERDAYIADVEGILKMDKKLGSYVHKGEILGEVHNPLDERTDKIVAKACGIIFSKKIQAKVEKGERILSILSIKGCKKHRIIPDQFKVIKNKEGRNVKIRDSLV